MNLKKRFLLATVLTCSSAVASEGTINVKSANGFDETIAKLSAALENKGMKIFATVPHSKGAAGAGIELRPTTLVLFGNPKVGAPLMACSQQAAIDLPQKALIYENEGGEVMLSYNDPAYLKSRHQIEGCEEVLEKISKALANFASAATSPTKP